MVDVLRQQLAELMQEEFGEEKTGSNFSFTEPNVCKPFLLGCCPYSLFLNTKMDRGRCVEEHNHELKKDYEEAREKEGKDIWHVEEETLKVLRKCVKDCDTRIREMESQQKEDSLNDVDSSKLIEISAQIDELSKKAELFGEEGKIEESILLVKQADGLKKLRDEIRASLRTGPVSHLMKFRICETCGAALVKENMDSRLADHFAGRLHNAFRVMREKKAWIENEQKRVGWNSFGKRIEFELERKSEEEKGRKKEGEEVERMKEEKREKSGKEEENGSNKQHTNENVEQKNRNMLVLSNTSSVNPLTPSHPHSHRLHSTTHSCRNSPTHEDGHTQAHAHISVSSVEKEEEDERESKEKEEEREKSEREKEEEEESEELDEKKKSEEENEKKNGSGKETERKHHHSKHKKHDKHKKHKHGSKMGKHRKHGKHHHHHHHHHKEHSDHRKHSNHKHNQHGKHIEHGKHGHGKHDESNGTDESSDDDGLTKKKRKRAKEKRKRDEEKDLSDKEHSGEDGDSCEEEKKGKEWDGHKRKKEEDGAV